MADVPMMGADAAAFEPRFDRYVDPARRRPALWRLIVGIILMTAIYAIGAALVIVAGWAILGATSDVIGFAESVASAGDPASVALLLATFLPMALAAMIVVRWLHKRPAASLFGPRVRVLRDFGKAAGIVALIYGGLTIVGLLFVVDVEPNLSLATWLSWLPILLLGLVIQTGAEELVFRGYLQQQLAARFVSPMIWLVIPAVLFGLVHYDPVTAGANLWYVLAGVTIFGLIAGDLTAKTGSLGAAWGFHFANNAFAMLIVATQGSIDGAALFRTPYTLAEAEGFGGLIIIDALVMILAWWLVRRAVSR